MSLITIILVFMMAIVVTVFISHLLSAKIPLSQRVRRWQPAVLRSILIPDIFLLLFIPPLL